MKDAFGNAFSAYGCGSSCACARCTGGALGSPGRVFGPWGSARKRGFGATFDERWTAATAAGTTDQTTSTVSSDQRAANWASLIGLGTQLLSAAASSKASKEQVFVQPPGARTYSPKVQAPATTVFVPPSAYPPWFGPAVAVGAIGMTGAVLYFALRKKS